MLMHPNVLLVPLERRHLDATRAWANDTELRSRILRVLPVGEQDQERWFENLATNPSRLVFAIQERDEGVHIGNTGLYNIDFLHRRAEFWILIARGEHRGRGYGRAALGLLVDYGFDELNLNRVYLHVGADNAPAIALYEKAGFRCEGVLREHYFIHGRYVDVLVMSRLRKDKNV